MMVEKICGATFEFANGECAHCGLESGHDGNHWGWVYGSRCQWAQGETSEYENYIMETRKDEETEVDNAR